MTDVMQSAYRVHMSEVTVLRGRAIIHRMFDVAEEIDLRAVEDILRDRAGTTRVIIANPAVIVSEAPVSLSLGTTALRLGTRSVDVELYARLWNYGALSFQFHLPIAPGTSWPELVALAALAEDDTDASAIARARAQELRALLSRAVRLPHDPASEEDYIIYLLEEIAGCSAAGLASSADIPALILGESRKLSEQTRRIILQSAHGYADNDLVVVDWNSALIVDPAGGRDAADVLEFAVTHLMEFRYFDDLLDQRLERLYDSVEKERRGSWLIRRDYELLSREATSLYVEFSDYRERVENSVKFFGDPFLASIFRTAAERFNLREWEESVSRKLATLAQTSQLLQGEVNVRRSHLLEIIIIVLILYEIVAAVV
jgi:hypothetical protein